MSGAFSFRVVQCRLHQKERTPTQEASSEGEAGALNKASQRSPLHLTHIGIKRPMGEGGGLESFKERDERKSIKSLRDLSIPSLTPFSPLLPLIPQNPATLQSSHSRSDVTRRGALASPVTAQHGEAEQTTPVAQLRTTLDRYRDLTE